MTVFYCLLQKKRSLKKDFDHFTNTIEQGTPIVMFDRVAASVDCNKVVTDDFEGAVNAVKHLSKTGFKKIAFISTLGDLTIGKEREEGYLKGLEEENIPVKKNLIISIEEDDYKKYESILTPIFEKQSIDSVIATDESSAIAAMKVAIRKGHKVPDDFAVIAFSNGILARHSSPKMTTVSQHGELMGSTAAEMLIRKIEKKSEDAPVRNKIIKTDLVERNSTKPCKF